MTSLDQAFAQEWSLAQEARRDGDLDRAFHHLGQRRTWLHVKSHLAMLQIGWQRRDGREIRGQAARIVAAALFSRLWVPVGNTGGANVPATRPMPVPPDLQAVIDDQDA